MKLLDFLKKEGYSEKEAISYIKTGQVTINSNKETLVNYVVKQTDKIQIKKKSPWVSRGAYKLLEAYKKFNLNFFQKTVLDIGSSTGGFTEVALHYGAQKVYAVDVGTNQLAYKLRMNPKVQVMEKTNLKDLHKNMFNAKIEIAMCDVSFISLKPVFQVLKNILEYKTILVALIKPQFQARKEHISPGGVVNIEHHKGIINNIKKQAKFFRFLFLDMCLSPIQGQKSKNTEYLALFRKELHE